MASIIEDINEASQWISKALKSSGYYADFSPESLNEIERFFNEHSKNGKPKKKGLLSEKLGSRMFGLGSYVGEVIRQNIGGKWCGDDNDPNVEINVELRLPDKTVCWPIQKVMKRLKNGKEDNIVAYAKSFGL